MNEHPVIRPVVIEPETPPAPARPVRSLPRGTKEMPLGLSANSVGLGDLHALRMRRLLFVGLPLTVVLALSVGVWLFARSLAPLTTRTLVNGVYQYNFLFYRHAEPVNLVAGQGFKYGGQALVIAKATNDDITDNCAQFNSKKSQWHEAFRVRVSGVVRPVCQLDGTIFLVTFYGPNQSTHLLEISYTTPSAANTADVRRIVESAKVSLE